MPPASVLGCLCCGCLRVLTRSLTRPVSPTARLSTGDPPGTRGLFRVDADTAPFESEDATSGSRARVCVCVCLSWPRRLGWPPGRVLVRLTFSCGRSGCALCLLGPLCAGLPLFVVVAVFFPFFPFLSVFWLHWALASCCPGPPLFFSPLPSPLFCSCFTFVFCWLRFFSTSFFISSVVCCLCGAVLVRMSWAVRCVAQCCCGRSTPAGAGLFLRCVVRCSLVVPVLCVLSPVVFRVSRGAVLAPFLFPVPPLVPCLDALSSCLVPRRLRPVVSLRFCGGVALLRQVLLCCFALRWFVLCWSLWCGVLPRCGVPCGVVHPPRPPARCALFFSLGGCAGSAAPRLVLVPCVVRCRALCLVVLRCVVCCAFCLVLYGVLVLGRVLVPYCPERCCAGSCCAVSVVFCCCVLLSSLLVFLCVVPCLSVLPRAVSVSLVLCRVAFLCWFALRCAVWCSAVPWCLSWPCAVLFVLLRCSGSVLPCPLLWRIVVLCMSLGAVLCRRPMLPVFRVLSFLLPCFWAPLFSWRLLCGAVLVCPRRCSLSGALSPLCVWLLVVSGCLLLGLAVLRCLMVVPGVVFRWCCPCLAAWLVALWFVVVYLGAPLPCAVFCGAVLSCCAAVLCCSFASLHVPVFCFLRLRVASMQKPKINTPWEPDIQFLE